MSFNNTAVAEGGGDDYEARRKKNIAEKEAFLASFLPKLESFMPEEHTVEDKPKPRVRRISKISPEILKPVRRSARIEKASKIKRVRGFKGFRKVKKTGILQQQQQEKAEPQQKITVCFPWQTHTRKEEKTVDETIKDPDTAESEYEYICDDEDESDDEWDDYEEVVFYISEEEEAEQSDSSDGYEYAVEKGRGRRRRRGITYAKIVPSFLAPEDVTQDMIDNIAHYSSGKNYSENGTCCHQCRQKTLDTKTVCRSGRCVGVRGQFCGPCLLNRYGESVEDALLNNEWSCPPCRNQCNCSICRSRAGKIPTGIMAPFIKTEGYGSVCDYLLKNEERNEENTKRRGKVQRIVGSRSKP